MEQQNFANISLNTIGQQTDRIETILMEGSRPSNSDVKVNLPLGMKTVGNGRKTPQPFSTSTFEYENENENSKVGHENEHELTEY